jgi:serine/threonine protein kinase
MSTPHPDCNLLLGVLALQNGFVAPDALLAGLHAWAADRGRALGEILSDRGALAAEHRRLLEDLVRAQAAPASTPATNQEPPPTTVHAAPRDRFHVVRPHAEGGIGQVFFAHDAELNRGVALKRIKDRFADHADLRTRFVREAEVTGGLEHPGVVPVYGLGRDADGRPYYAMRFVRGESLAAAVARFHGRADAEAGERALELRGLLERFVTVCDTVAYAHSRGVVHRDLKPANVLLGPYGETLVVDWGLAKTLDEPTPAGDDDLGPVRPLAGGREPPTEFGRRLGTLAYMAPEQAAGRVDLHDPRTDVYGLGAVLYEILTGRPPHDGDDASAVLTRILTADAPRARDRNPAAPAALDAGAARAMARAPADRHASAAELAREVRRWLADEPVVAYRQAAEELSRLVEQYPDVTGYREQRARARVSLGTVLHGLGRHAEAEEAFRAALADCDALRAASPRTARYRADRASALLDLANALERQGRAADAAECRRGAVVEYDRLRAANPRDYRTNLASVMLTLLPGAAAPAPPAAARAGAASAETEAGTGPADATAAASPGQPRETRGRYTLVRPLALGGAATVWLARDDDLNRHVVVKELYAAGEEHRQRFLMEAQVTAQLRHPNIVPVHGLGFRTPDNTPFLVQAYVGGWTLLEAVKAAHRAGGGEALRPLVVAFAQVCDALAYAHTRGVLHLDPKPSNVLLDRVGRAVVTDWGLALVRPRPGQKNPVVVSPWARPPAPAPGAVFGTPAYLAPEMLLGRPDELDARTDVFLLGATLFHVLTGRPPRKKAAELEKIRESGGDDLPRPRAVRPAVPGALDAVCARAMARARDDRYPTAADLAADVRAWLAGKSG